MVNIYLNSTIFDSPIFLEVIMDKLLHFLHSEIVDLSKNNKDFETLINTQGLWMLVLSFNDSSNV